jgi:tRNA(Arg) A34 adenosine deaminase TadA
MRDPQTIQKYLLEALAVAEQNMSKERGGPFGAIVVRGDKIVGRGGNRVTAINDPTAHAEVQAIRDACKNLGSFQLDDCEIYSSCEPCPMCLGAIYWARPKALYFASDRKDAADAGFDDDFIYREIALPTERRSILTQGVPFDGHLRVFELWKKKSDRIDY